LHIVIDSAIKSTNQQVLFGNRYKPNINKWLRLIEYRYQQIYAEFDLS